MSCIRLWILARAGTSPRHLEKGEGDILSNPAKEDTHPPCLRRETLTHGTLLRQQEQLLGLNIVREQAVTQACVHVPRLTLHPRAQVECQRQ